MADLKPWHWAILITLLVSLNIVVVGGLIVVIATYDLWANPTYLAAEPTVPAWATPTATQRPTFTPTFTPQVWPTATPTRTPTRTPPATPTWTPLPTRTPWPTDTPTPYQPPTDTPTPTPTRTRVPTRTPWPTDTPTPYQPPTDTLTPAPTSTPLPTYTFAPQPTFTLAPTITYTPSPALTSLPTPTEIPIIAGSLDTATRSPTLRPSPSPTHRLSPTMTYTPRPSPSATHTATPSPSATHTPTPLPSPTATATSSPSPVASNTALPVVSDITPMEAIPLDDNSIGLSWEPVADVVVYRVYSDMGTGYGVYLFKAETEQHNLTDTSLCTGSRYRYRVRSVSAAGEKAIAWATAVTPALSDPRTRGSASTASARDASALSVPKPTPSSVRVTPAPTPLPPDTVILGLLSATDFASDVDDTLTIVGEVRNDSHLDVGQAIVAVTFYGTDGQVIGEVSGPTVLRALAPGIRSPFIITLPRPAGLANYSLRATGRPIDLTTTNEELNVVNTRRFEDSVGFYHVAGVIENPSGQRVEQARVVVTLYDRGGRVVNVGFAYPQPPSLSPSDRADFDVAFTYYPKVFSHLAIAVGD